MCKSLIFMLFMYAKPYIDPRLPASAAENKSFDVVAQLRYHVSAVGLAGQTALSSRLELHVRLCNQFASLEQRLESVECGLRAEIEALQRTVDQLRPASGPSINRTQRSKEQAALQPATDASQENGAGDCYIVLKGTVSEEQWHELHSFFDANCTTVIGFMDDQLYPPIGVVKQHPLMSTIICLVASRAVMPEKYQACLEVADDLVKRTFGGPTPDLLTVKALMLLAAWTGRPRLWGYVASIAAELKLNAAVLQLGDATIDLTEETVDRARTWLSLCCFDLIMNLNRPFVINRMRDYLPFAADLLASPHRRPVDHRICAYTEGFAIAANAKAQLQNTKLHVSPLPAEVTALLDSSNHKIDGWFYAINNSINPLYQTFHGKQDRNRFLVPYSFLKIYTNGFALYGITPDGPKPDKPRLDYLQQALDNAIIVIRTQYDSPALRAGLRYTMDYSGITTFNAINFIFKAMNAAHLHLNYSMVFPALHQAAQMFEQAGAVDAANDIRREQDRLAMMTNTILSPEVLENGQAERDVNALFDIPSFWDEAVCALFLYFV
ncbi:putative Transcription factor domain-containing protein [Seiridium cardinale]